MHVIITKSSIPKATSDVGKPFKHIPMIHIVCETHSLRYCSYCM